jgi:flagellar biosynthesis protein FlhA
MATNTGAIPLQGFLSRLNATQLAAPVMIMAILAMMVLPLPAFVLDVLFTFNIARRRSISPCFLRFC